MSILKDNIGMNVKILKYIGLWPEDFSRNGRKIYLCYSWGILFIIVLLVSSEIAALYAFNGDFHKSTINICVILVTTASVGKMLGFILMDKKHSHMVTIFNQNFEMEVHHGRETIARKLTVVFFCFGGVMCVVWGAAPLISGYFHMWNDPGNSNDTYVWELPNISWYPYDIKKSPMFELTYLFHVICGALYSIGAIAADTFYISLMIHTSSQFRILGQSFKNLGNDKVRPSFTKLGDTVSTEYNSGTDISSTQHEKTMITPFMSNSREEYEFATVTTEKGCGSQGPDPERDTGDRNATSSCRHRCNAQMSTLEAELSQCVRYHQDVIRFVKSLEEVLRPCMLLQFFCSCATICLSGFQATQPVIDLPSRLKFITFLSIATFQLFIYCWFGNDLSQESLRLQNSVFQCGWHLMPTSFRKSVSIVMERTKRPVTLSAGKMYLINLQTFLTILNTAYSMFVVLRQMNESYGQ